MARGKSNELIIVVSLVLLKVISDSLSIVTIKIIVFRYIANVNGTSNYGKNIR